jgi:RNA polymerase sigma-70 factor (ECF subfamily)
MKKNPNQHSTRGFPAPRPEVYSEGRGRERIPVSGGDSTEIGGGGGAFPTTSWTLLRAAADRSSEEWKNRLGSLLQAYWKPVYQCIRARWRKSNEDAKDLTQGFFALLMEGNDLARVTREHGTFRSYLKTALDHFLIDEQRKAEALKRGGTFDRVPLDVSALEGSIADPGSTSPEEAFDREWVATLMAEATRDLESALRAEGRELYFRAFQLYYLDGPNSSSQAAANPHSKGETEGEGSSHGSVAAQLGLEPYDVNNYLMYARRKLRLLLKERVSSYAASEQDALREFGFVLGE